MEPSSFLNERDLASSKLITVPVLKQRLMEDDEKAQTQGTQLSAIATVLAETKKELEQVKTIAYQKADKAERLRRSYDKAVAVENAKKAAREEDDAQARAVAARGTGAGAGAGSKRRRESDHDWEATLSPNSKQMLQAAKGQQKRQRTGTPAAAAAATTNTKGKGKQKLAHPPPPSGSHVVTTEEAMARRSVRKGTKFYTLWEEENGEGTWYEATVIEWNGKTAFVSYEVDGSEEEFVVSELTDFGLLAW